MLSENDDGTMVAECLLIPGIKCFGLTRNEALEIMHTLVTSALRTTRVKPTKYEVVHLAIGKSEPRLASRPLARATIRPDGEPEVTVVASTA
jgi:hypothetical protein